MRLSTSHMCGMETCDGNDGLCVTITTLSLNDAEVRRLIRIGESWGKGLHYPGNLTREVAIELVETLKVAD